MKSYRLAILAGVFAVASTEAAEPFPQRPDTEILANACAGCHGTRGHSLPPTPNLAGKSEDEFISAMREFKSKQRVSSIMNRIAQGYTEEDIAALAGFFKHQ